MLAHNSISLTFWTILLTENIGYPFNIFPVIGTLGTKYLKCKSNRQWRSHQRLQQTQWLRISYRQLPLVEYWCSYTPIVRCWLDLLGVVPSILDFYSKNFQNISKLLTQGYRYNKLRKTFGKFFRSYSELLSKFVKYRFKEIFLTLSSQNSVCTANCVRNIWNAFTNMRTIALYK